MQSDMHLSEFTESERKMLKPLLPEEGEDEKPELFIREVADETGIHQSNISRKFRELESQGILESRKSEEDARRSIYSISGQLNESVFSLRRQEEDIEDIKSFDATQIQQDAVASSNSSITDISIILYGAENRRLNIQELGLESQVREIVNKLKKEFEDDFESQFQDRLEDLIEDRFEEDEQEKVLEHLEQLTDALWDSKNLRVEYLEERKDELTKEELGEMLVRGPENTIEMLSIKSEALKECMASLEEAEEFIDEAQEIAKECKSLKLIIDS